MEPHLMPPRPTAMTTPAPAPARRRVRALLASTAVLLLGLGLVPLLATPAAACSCVAALSDEEYADAADAVFVGRVDDVHPTAPAAGSSSDPTVATIVVDEVYKGDVHAYTDVVTASSSASCGLEPVRGQTLLVFASYGGDGVVEVAPDQLRANLCDGTRAVDVDPITLVAGHAPMVGASEADTDGGFPLLGWLAFVAVAGLGAMPIALWLRMRSRLHHP